MNSVEFTAKINCELSGKTIRSHFIRVLAQRLKRQWLFLHFEVLRGFSPITMLFFRVALIRA
jgi:hypothetical protein